MNFIRVAGQMRSFAFLCAAAPLIAQVSVRITSPTSGTIVNPGQRITVSVSVTGGPVSGVVIGGALVDIGAPQTSPPYQFNVTIPSSGITPGPSNLFALAGVPGSNGVFSTPVTLDIERADPPVSIKVQETSLDFDGIGQTDNLLVWGTYADGSVLNITQSTLTKYTVFTASSPVPVTVTSAGQVTSVAVGSGKIGVIGANGTFFVPFTVQPPVSVQPYNWSLLGGQQQQYFARVSPGSGLASGVTWSMSPSIGTLSSSGLYTAPNTIDPDDHFVVITATSTADPTQSGRAYLTLIPLSPSR